MSKVLGDGVVRKTGRTCMIVDKAHNRSVEITDSALRVNYGKKLYEPEDGDYLIFSAQLQPNTAARYTALSVVRPIDLIQSCGTLTLLDEKLKFGHITINGKTAKCFVPFSTRTANGTSWYGQGAELKKAYQLQMFRQEESHGCKYVAWTISDDIRKLANLPPAHMDVQYVSPMKKLGTANVVQRQSDHQSVEFVQKQCGVIYDVTSSLMVSVTSPTSQNVEFSPRLYESWMKPGRFMSYDGRRVSDDKTSNLMGSQPQDMGAIYPIRKRVPLTLSVSAVFNKVSHGKAGWAWNDHVGRIYVPWNCTDRHMHPSKPLPFTPVHLDITYNGKHDDIPWVACSASLCDEHEYEQVIEDNAQMLKTEDNWKVHSVIDSIENPSVFLTKLDENGQKRCAFAKVIDLNSGNIPATGTLVRITYYVQERHGRHAIRCVLVTTMDKVDHSPKTHIAHNGTGEKRYPALFEQPCPRKKTAAEIPVQRIHAAPLPTKNCWNMKNLGSPTAQALADDFPSVNGEVEKDDDLILTSVPPPPPGIPLPPGFVAPLSTQKSSLPKGAYYEEDFDSFIPLAPLRNLNLENLRFGSIWSGTPVEAKPDEISSYFSHDTFLNSPFNSLPPALSPTGETFFTELTASISQPSTSSAVNSGPISDLRNTQSEASSPGLKSDVNEPVEEQANCWSSLDATSNNTNVYSGSFSFGFPHIDLPIYQKMVPSTNGMFSPLSEPKPKKVMSRLENNNTICSCDSDQLLRELWQNPLFKNAFSASDPETFIRVQQKLQTFESEFRH
uniref:RHD domain-containing protein n=1 Tax=Caenorhabditis tropicalis TaxID=1561998 RepID=A0A1I7T590_9PELO